MSIIYSEQLGAIRLAELNKFAEHIPAEVLTMRVLEIAIESSGLTIGDVIDLHERVEDHAKATRLTSMFLHEWAHWANAAVGKVEGSDGTEVLVNLEKVEPPDEWTYSGSSQPETIAPAVTPEPVPEKADTDAELEEAASEEVQEQPQTEVPEKPEEQALKAEPEPQVEGEAESLPVCKRCGESKDQEQFSRNRWGYTSVCKECRSGKHKTPQSNRTSADTRPNETADDQSDSETERPEGKRVSYCVNGEDCVAFKSTGQPTKLARDNTSGECGGCVQADQQRIRRGEKKRSVGR